jgi:hypothetical protein
MRYLLTEAGAEVFRKPRLAPANEMNDLVTIIGLHFGAFPIRPRQDIEIALDRNAISGHAEMFEKRGNRKAVGNVAWLAVDANLY